jgi:crotonobetainyl-CoA:carnitine CoA-transferase CaiB-like acyl-CoA transferase
MMPLHGHVVVALEDCADSPLARLFVSFGATLRRVTLDELQAAVAAASFLIERLGLPHLEAAGLSRARIERLNPRLIHVSVTTFGSAGPYAGWLGSELIASAMGGPLLLTGDPDRPPVKEALDACFFHADMVAAAGAMSAHHERGASGLGQHVDVAAQEVAFSRCINSILVWQFDHRKLHRVGGALNYGLATVRCIWPLRDGWCFHTLMTGRFGAPANQALSDWIDAVGLDNPLRGVDWLSYNRSTLPTETRATWERSIAAFFASRSKQEIAAEGRRRGINATVICEPSDVLADEHLQQRAFWNTQNAVRRPGRFVGILDGDAAPARPAAPPGSAPSSAAAKRSGPLAGVRVLDFSWALVGSITTKILGDLGAEIIKIESRTRPCLSRIDVQVKASTAGNFDDKPWFAHLNSSKQSIALDMKKPESREVIEPLIQWADVIVENFSPGTMAKLGLSYAALRTRKPDIIMISGSVYGQTGALAQEWGVDGTGAALAGRTFLTGWPDRDPVIPGAVPYGDVIVPYVMAAAAAAALQRRREHGRGCHVDASMYEICVQQMYKAIEQAQSAEAPRRSGNSAPDQFHQNLYPVAGSDRWIAISCATERQWTQLLSLAGITAVDRVTADAELAGWTAPQSGAALMATLQSQGIAAGMVQDAQDLIDFDPQLKFRGALKTLDHPSLGPFGHVRTPLSLSRSMVSPYRPPRLGEHSVEVATTLAGLSEARVYELQSLGVFK